MRSSVQLLCVLLKHQSSGRHAAQLKGEVCISISTEGRENLNAGETTFQPSIVESIHQSSIEQLEVSNHTIFKFKFQTTV